MTLTLPVTPPCINAAEKKLYASAQKLGRATGDAPELAGAAYRHTVRPKRVCQAPILPVKRTGTGVAAEGKLYVAAQKLGLTTSRLVAVI